MRTPAPRTTRSGAVARAADRFVIGDIRAVEKARCRERGVAQRRAAADSMRGVEGGVAQRRAAADSMLICPAEKRMTKHHVSVQITDTRDRSRYRYVGENDTMREIRAGAAQRPGTIVRVWRHTLTLGSRVLRLRSRLTLTDKTLNRKRENIIAEQKKAIVNDFQRW